MNNLDHNTVSVLTVIIITLIVILLVAVILWALAYNIKKDTKEETTTLPNSIILDKEPIDDYYVEVDILTRQFQQRLRIPKDILSLHLYKEFKNITGLKFGEFRVQGNIDGNIISFEKFVVLDAPNEYVLFESIT